MPSEKDGVMIILSSPSGAPEGDDNIIITPSFSDGIKISS